VRWLLDDSLVPWSRHSHPLLAHPGCALQDISAVEDAQQACQQQGLQLPDGFVKVIAMRPPRANATQVA
jgi:hypothetical protein